jgi:hypothetical protein
LAAEREELVCELRCAFGRHADLPEIILSCFFVIELFARERRTGTSNGAPHRPCSDLSPGAARGSVYGMVKAVAMGAGVRDSCLLGNERGRAHGRTYRTDSAYWRFLRACQGYEDPLGELYADRRRAGKPGRHMEGPRP